MRRSLAAERGLTVLSLAPAGDPGEECLRCDLRVGDTDVGEAHFVTLERLGLAPAATRAERYDRSRRRDPAREVRFPPDDRDALTQMLADALDPGETLWLEVARSFGLPAIPWERWLQPAARGPLLRLPYLAVHPAHAGDRLDLVVCASAPMAKLPFPIAELIGATVRQVVGAGLPARFHVFTDASEHPAVEGALQDAIDAGVAVLYSPGGSSAYGAAPRVRGIAEPADPTALESPWLRWIVGELPDVTVDLALFLCHGYYSDGLGALAFAESPLEDHDRSWSRFVGSRQLVGFLDQLGAAGLVTVSPPHGFSLSGSLALADEIARDRPGPVMALDLENDDGETLGRALAFLFGAGGDDPPAAPGLAFYCHPDLLLPEALVRELDLAAPEPEIALESHTLARPAPRGARRGLSIEPAGGLEGVRGAPAATPRWAAASQRIMERRAADLSGLDVAGSEVGEATRDGRDGALRFVADLLRKSLDEGES